MENISQPGSNSNLHSVKIKAISTLSTIEEKVRRYILKSWILGSVISFCAKKNIPWTLYWKGRSTCLCHVRHLKESYWGKKMLMKSLKSMATAWPSNNNSFSFQWIRSTWVPARAYCNQFLTTRNVLLHGREDENMSFAREFWYI